MTEISSHLWYKNPGHVTTSGVSHCHVHAHSKGTCSKLFNRHNVEYTTCSICPTILLAPDSRGGTLYHWLHWWTICDSVSIDVT